MISLGNAPSLYLIRLIRSVIFLITYFMLLLVAFPSAADELDVGRQIYENGILPNGKLLMGLGAGEQQLVGKEAACANCHKKSGMGGVEGKTLIPPISADFLFKPEKHALAVTDPSYPMGITMSDHSYSDSGLVKAFTKGINYDGRALISVMPRYQLDDESIKHLVNYLHNLSAIRSIGIDDDGQNFAAVFTPEVDNKTREIVKAEIEAFVVQHNSNLNQNIRHRRVGFDWLRTKDYPWKFHYWDLKGDQSTWMVQLEAYYKQQPVFAFVSGVSFQSADPVQDFCEKYKTPCLFRSVLYPPDTLSFYSVYFSKGIGLDSALLATGLKNGIIKKPSHVLQIMSSDKMGERITADLGKRLLALKIPEDRISLQTKNLNIIREKLETLKSNELLVCWCDQSDIDRLGNVHIPKHSRIYFSGSLMMMKSGLTKFSDTWKTARLIFPYEEPDKRLRQLSSFYSWVTGHGFDAKNEVIQSDTYLSMLILQEALGQMVNNHFKDYLLERTENIFGMSYNYWGMYSRPSLGPLQRYASKSGYISKYKNNRWVPESIRIVEE